VCGRFAQQRPSSELADIFGAEDLADDPGERYNVAPTDAASVVARRGDRTAIVSYRCGLIPHWAETPKVGSRMFNARAETLARSPAFRDALRRKRCLVPVDGFYEWRREGSRRQPFRVVGRDGRPLVLAGIWDGWHDPDTDRVIRSFAIVTTASNEDVAAIHGRMPVVLPEDAWATWLDTELADPGELQGLLVPAPDGSVELYPVHPLVNNVRNDGPELIEPLAG
jgi:putative SOS response-associated peptidase YedK